MRKLSVTKFDKKLRLKFSEGGNSFLGMLKSYRGINKNYIIVMDKNKFLAFSQSNTLKVTERVKKEIEFKDFIL